MAGAFLVAPPDVANPGIRPKHLMTFGPYPRDKLPFPSITIGSRTIPSAAGASPRTSPRPGGRCSSMPARPATSTRMPAMARGRKESIAFAKFLSRLPS